MRVRLYLLTKPIWVAIAYIGLVACNSEQQTQSSVFGESFNPNESISYSLQVKPILSDRCFACHGQDADNRKADLQLHSPEMAYKKFKDGSQAIVPGNAELSVVYQRLISEDPDYIMPPPSSHTTVTQQEIQIIKAWIDQGAEYEKHWAYIPPKKAALPKIESDWPSNDIDFFTLRKMQQKGLTPTQTSDKATLIRRAFIDVTGVIPTAEQMDKYLRDDSENAYETLLEDLFASPRYGEKMASYWLELARYGDTDGYQNDGPRNMWPWRDWVINAFNENMPFDQFMTEQLAGDLLSNPSKSQIIATGFNRNTSLNNEGGIIPEEFRVEYIADKIDVTSTTFLGQTMACARCHDHKYDPLSQRDYYRMFAFFNNTAETGKANGLTSKPYVHYYAEDENRQLAERLIKKINAIGSDLKIFENQNDVQYKSSSFDKALVDSLSHDKGRYFAFDKRYNSKNENIDLANTLIVPGKYGNALRFSASGKYTGFLQSRHRPSFKNNQAIGVSLWTRSPTDDELAILDSIPEYQDKTAVKLNSAPSKGFKLASMLSHTTNRGFDLSLNLQNQLEFTVINAWPESALKVVSHSLPEDNAWQHVYVQYDGNGKASGVGLFLNGKKLQSKVIQDNLSGDTDPGWTRLNFGATPFSEPNKYRGRDIDEVRFFETTLNEKTVAQLASLSPWGLEGNRNEAYPTEQLSSNKLYLSEKSEYFIAQEKQQRLEGYHSVVAMVMQDVAPTEDPVRPTYLLSRGDYSQPEKSEILQANIPSYFGDLQGEYPQNRLGLAKWLASDDNPLTARVMVNRLWQIIFGRGIVTTSENFGNQGELPSHPKLLDWLAIEFKQSGWDVKYMMKLMMLSSTYRQSSDIPGGITPNDPENIFLARGTRARMSAEAIRDSTLQASGLLVDELGGPSVKPYQPDGLWEAIAAKGTYQQSSGKGLYRRSIYSYWKRTVGVPSMTLFDASTKDYCVSRRQSTNTPLQALLLLNDPQYVEAARVLAHKAYEHTSGSEQRINYIARSLLNRDLGSEEMQELLRFYDEVNQEFITDPERARALLNVGAYNSEITNEYQADIAAYAVLSSAVMNLSEFITRQ
ncbi:DUF1553 domain-containing protein [Agaribacter marinus]|uniref:Planctomycete cytochrome C n=1 Tax=Agaribacter marinus TaxID=1431249 RepID=A0AA37WJJ5_9ALTE|nr:DUF1553 domain-containing protein [Agaribacter marinus]GLR70294.1 hypothetical protein GCM10007852_12020 [Agaribacter marinus]